MFCKVQTVPLHTPEKLSDDRRSTSRTVLFFWSSSQLSRTEPSKRGLSLKRHARLELSHAFERHTTQKYKSTMSPLQPRPSLLVSRNQQDTADEWLHHSPHVRRSSVLSRRRRRHRTHCRLAPTSHSCILLVLVLVLFPTVLMNLYPLLLFQESFSPSVIPPSHQNTTTTTKTTKTTSNKTITMSRPNVWSAVQPNSAGMIERNAKDLATKRAEDPSRTRPSPYSAVSSYNNNNNSNNTLATTRTSPSKIPTSQPSFAQSSSSSHQHKTKLVVSVKQRQRGNNILRLAPHQLDSWKAPRLIDVEHVDDYRQCSVHFHPMDHHHRHHNTHNHNLERMTGCRVHALTHIPYCQFGHDNELQIHVALLSLQARGNESVSSVLGRDEQEELPQYTRSHNNHQNHHGDSRQGQRRRQAPDAAFVLLLHRHQNVTESSSLRRLVDDTNNSTSSEEPTSAAATTTNRDQFFYIQQVLDHLAIWDPGPPPTKKNSTILRTPADPEAAAAAAVKQDELDVAHSSRLESTNSNDNLSMSSSSSSLHNKDDPDPLACTHHLSGRVMMITRYEYCNLFHTVLDWFQTFLTLPPSPTTIMDQSPVSNVSIVFLDGHARGALDDVWRQLFGPTYFIRSSFLLGESQPQEQHQETKKNQQISPVICLRNVTLIPSGYSSVLWRQSQSPSSLKSWKVCPRMMHAFVQYVVTAYQLQHVTMIPGKVTVIDRRPYLAHPRSNLDEKARRFLHNLPALVQALQETQGRIPGGITSVELVALETLTFEQQLRLMRQSHVLIGNHGAGLTHLLFLHDTALVLEYQQAFTSMAASQVFTPLVQWKQPPPQPVPTSAHNASTTTTNNMGVRRIIVPGHDESILSDFQINQTCTLLVVQHIALTMDEPIEAVQ